MFSFTNYSVLFRNFFIPFSDFPLQESFCICGSLSEPQISAAPWSIPIPYLPGRFMAAGQVKHPMQHQGTDPFTFRS